MLPILDIAFKEVDLPIGARLFVNSTHYFRRIGKQVTQTHQSLPHLQFPSLLHIKAIELATITPLLATNGFVLEEVGTSATPLRSQPAEHNVLSSKLAVWWIESGRESQRGD
jgi:hypothetical protein